ncbi:MAG: hypothetical protein ACI9MC_000284 [Kiritimatiellia bacterium]|jgi:hypothetical protein
MAWKTGTSLDLSATVTAVEVVSGPQPRVLVVGPSHTWLIHPGTGEVLADQPVGGDAVVQSPGGVVWVCGADGLRRMLASPSSLSTAVSIDGASCRNVEHYRVDDVERLVVAGQRVRVYDIGDDLGLVLHNELAGPLTGWPLLAVDKRRFAVVGEGAAQIVEEGPWGASTLAAGGEVGGIATSSTSWIWSLPLEDALVDVTRKRVSVAAGPGRLAAGDVDGDGVVDVIVAHPSSSSLGVVLGGTTSEILVQVPVGVVAVRSANVDADQCAEIVAVTASGGVRVLQGPCGAEERAVDAAEQSGGDPLMIGEGWPSVEVRVGERVDLQLRDELGQASAWAASGGPDGLVVTSTGTALYRAQEGHIGRWRVSVRMWSNGAWLRRGGFEIIVRAGDPASTANTASAPRAVRAAVYRGATDLTIETAEDVGKLRRPLTIRGCNMGVGGVLGFSKVNSSWVMLGEEYILSGSPALALSCEGTLSGDFWWSAGLDMAPWFVYIVQDSEMRHSIAATFSAGFAAREDLQLGVHVTVGSTIFGVGVMSRWLPFVRQSGARHGPEFRLTMVPSRGIVLEGVVLYNFQLGPFHPPGPRESTPPNAEK